MAKKHPKEFYDQLLHQDMKKYSVNMRGNIKGEMTKRPAFRIIMSIREALVKRIGENIGQEYAQDIQNAFDAQTIDEKLMQMVQQNHVDLRDEKNNLLLAKAMSSEVNADTGAAVNISVDSPNVSRLQRAELQIKENHFSDLQDDVIKFVKQNSNIRDAKRL